MALDLQALSISSAFSSILNFFKSQENNSKWKCCTDICHPCGCKQCEKYYADRRTDER